MKPAFAIVAVLAVCGVAGGSFFVGMHYANEQNVDLGRKAMRMHVTVKMNEVSDALSLLKMLEESDLAGARQILEVQLTSGLTALRALSDHAQGTDALLVKEMVDKAMAYARERNLKIPDVPASQDAQGSS